MGKVPKEPTKPIENKSKNLLKPSENENSTETSPNIQNNPRNSEQKFLTTKIKQLEQEKQAQEQTIINLKNERKGLEELNNSLNSLNKRLEKELIRTQQEKHTLLKMLTIDLKKQNDQLSKQVEKPVIQELHQQLIAQI